MSRAKNTVGFIVVEKAEEFEQPLGITKALDLPPGGILDWTDGPIAVFPSRYAARSAITRTECYRIAFRKGEMLPLKKFCRVRELRATT